MEFRRKTKALSKVPSTVYFAFFLFLTMAYFAFSYSFKQEIMPITDNDLLKEEIIEEHDSLSKPDIYIPEATIIPIDTIKKDEIVISETKPEKVIVEKETLKNDKKKSKELAKVEPKQRELKMKQVQGKPKQPQKQGK